MKKIAIIGAGNMGSAIAESLNGSDYQVWFTATSQKTLDKVAKSCPNAVPSLSNTEAVKGADIIVLAVKPYLIDNVVSEINPEIKHGATIISVAAGITTWDLEQIMAAQERKLNVFRVIPNTAIRLGKSATFISHSDDSTPESVAEVEAIFSLSGTVFPVEESKMAACTALSSCGIAYFLRFLRAAAEGAVEIGLKPGFATEVAAVTAEGAAALVEDGGHPEAEIDKVTTPGGITIRGLNAMEDHGFTRAVIAGIRASYIK